MYRYLGGVEALRPAEAPDEAGRARGLALIFISYVIVIVILLYLFITHIIIAIMSCCIIAMLL